MADKLKKNQRILNSDWDDETLSYREKLIERQRLEDEKRAQEERVRQETAAARTTSLDEFGSMKGMQEALDRPSVQEEAKKVPADYGRLDALGDQFSGGEAYKDAADAFDELGELETKYSTKEQRAEARVKLQEDINFYSRDRATFNIAGQANAELIKVEKAEELFSTPGKVEQLKAEVASKLALAGAKSARSDDYYNTTGNYGTRTIGDIAGSHESAWSIAGGLVGGATLGPAGAFAGAAVGSIPSFEVARKAAYMEGAMAGMSEQQAREFSKLMGGSEFVLSALGQGGAAALSGVLKREAKKRIVDSVKTHVAKTVAKQTLFGGAEEAGTVGVQAGIAGSLMDNEEYTDKTRLFLAEKAYVEDGKFDVNGFFSDAARAAAAGAGTTGAVTTPVETLSSMAEAGRTASRLQAHLLEKRTNKTTSEPVAPDNSVSADFLKMTQGELFGEGGKSEPATTATPVEEADAVNQWQLRTKAATIRTQLDKDRSALSALQQRIERAPFAEEAADLLTNQERGDMQRLQARIPIQEQRLAEIESATVPIQSSLPLGEKRQPKSPKFTGEERTSEQLRSDYFKTQPVQGPAPMPPELRKEAQRTKVEELKRSKKEVTDADKKAKAQYEAARRKHLDGIRAGLMDLDPNTRAARLAEAAITWKVNNPLVLPSKQATTTAPAQSQAAAPVEGEATIPVTTLDDTLKNAPEGSVALPNATLQGGTGVTLDDVSRVVGGGKRDKLASRLSYMVEDGNLEIVQDQSDIAGQIGRMKQQGKGWYDPETGKTYLVASNLDSKNTRGDILATLAHETKHGADFGGSEGLARSFKSFVGAEANANMAAKIRAAAKAGDKSAQYAVSRVDSPTYQGLGLSADQTGSEIVANYISAEAKKSGVTTSLYRGIVSPIRAGAKKLLRSNDVSLGDINYMADSLVSEVAARGERIDPSIGVALPMTISGGTSEAQQLRDNRTWLSADGKRKYEISDRESSIQIPEDYQEGDTLNIQEVLSHPKLFEELPDLAKVKIRFAPLGAGTGAQYTKNTNTITVNSNDPGFAGGGNYVWNGRLHQYIIHEMQHAAQKKSGTTNGASPEDFLSPEGRALRQKRDDYKGAINAAQSLGSSPEDYADLEQELTQVESMVKEEEEKATAAYMRVLGEHEARRADQGIEFSEAELDASGLGQQETRWNTETGITTERGKLIRPSVRAMPNAVEQMEQDNRTWGEKKKDSNALVRVIDDLTSTTEGFGIDMFKLLDARQGLRGDFSLRAETAGSKMEQGIRDAAKNRGTTINKISGELETKLKEINKLDTKEQREAAVKALDKDYPGVGTALNELRNLKWAFARKIVEQRRAQGTDLTPKEQNIYGAIIQNAETYTTRAYVSNQMPGKKFAKRRLKEIKNNPKGEEATKYNEAIQFIIDNHLAIPSKADLQALKGGEVRRFYESWFGNSDGVDVETMVNKLDSIPRKDREAHNTKAEEIAKELMGFKKTRGTVARGYAGARQNRTILEGRENVPDEIRYLMGEITNPLAAEMMSIARLINLYTQTNMLQNFAAQGKDRWYKDYNSGDFSIQLTSDAYGPMKGKFVTPTAAKFLEPAVTVGLDLEQALGTSAKDIGELAKITANAIKLGAQKATGLVKMVDLVTSPAAMVWNYIGAYGIVAQNGANPKYIAKAQRNTLRAIKAHYGNTGMNAEQQAEIQELIRSRVLDSATVGEYQQSFYDNMFRFLEDADTETGGKNLQLKIARGIKDGSMVARDAYAFMDMWAKVAAFYDRKDYLTKFYEANGDKVDNEAIIREAGQDITGANISYTRALKAVKILERNVPMFTMYLTYFSEVPRSLVFSAALAGKDFVRAKNAKTPQAKSLANGAGLRRTAGTLAMTAALASVINYYLDGLGDDEERRRKTDPDWEERGVPVPLGKTKDGKLATFNLLRADPNGPLTEFMVHLANKSENDDLTDVLAETFKNQFVQAKPVMATLRLISGLAGRETTNYEDDHGAFYDTLDSYSIGKDTNLGRNLAAVLEGFTPRVVKGTYRSIKGRVGNRGYGFDPVKEPDIALAQAIGITPSVRDPEFSLGIAAGNYKKAKKEANETLGTLKSRYTRMDGSALIKELADIVENEEKAYRDLYEVYDGTKAFNGYYTDKDYAKAATSIIKDEKLGPAASDIVNGSFNVRFVSRKFLNEWRDARISKIKEMKSDKEKSTAMAALRNDYRMVADYLGGQRKE